VSGFVQISNTLAERIAGGDWTPGTQLPSMRDLARQEKTTPSTVARAFRRLAEVGAINLSERRRAIVAPAGAAAAKRLLGTATRFRLAASDDPALDLLLRHTDSQVEIVGARGSFPALAAVRRGEADGAAIHLLHSSGVYNAPFAVTLLKGRRPHLLHLWQREQGIVVPAGNPRHIRTAAGLRRLRVAKREVGSGTRVLLDQLLRQANVKPDEVAGPELRSHLETALAVASGMADAALGLPGPAHDLGLDFVPLRWEHYDIVLTAEALIAAEPLLNALHDQHVVKELESLDGYRLRQAGLIEAL
jgi:molybdate-binding protein